MFGFYWRSIQRMPLLAVEAVKRVDTTVGFLTIIVWVAIGGSAAGAWWQRLPWQLPVFAFVAFLGYGFFRAVYLEYSVGEEERDRLRRGKTTGEKRTALKDALGDASFKGQTLLASDPTVEAAERWVNDTADLIEAALGKGEVQLFANAPGLTLYSSQNETHQQVWIKGRLHRLSQLIVRVDGIDLRLDFDPDEWRNRE